MTDEMNRLIQVLLDKLLILPIDAAYIRGFITEAQWLDDRGDEE